MGGGSDHERDRVKVGEEGVLWINTEPDPVRLHEFHQDKLDSFIYVRPANVLGTVALQWNLGRVPSVHWTLAARTTFTLGTLYRNRSILFRKRITDVRRNHLEFTTDSKSANDSVIRF